MGCPQFGPWKCNIVDYGNGASLHNPLLHAKQQSLQLSLQFLQQSAVAAT